MSVSRRAGLPHFGHWHSRKLRVLAERIAAAVRHEVFGQHDRQLVVRHGLHAAVAAVDQRDRAAPVALARNAPVAQPEVHAALAAALRLEQLRERVERLVEVEAVELPGIDQRAVLEVRLVVDVGRASRPPAASPGGCAGRSGARTRSRAGRARARPSPRRCRSPSARSSRPTPGRVRR